jgi:DNA-3-methyladenine glycosylase II
MADPTRGNGQDAYVNPLAVQHLRRVDRKLARVIQQVGGCPLAPRRGVSPYQALVKAVAYQQLNGKAADTIFRRFRAQFSGDEFPAPEHVIAAPEEQLRRAGLSRAKTAAIRDIAAKTIAGVVPTRRAIARLADVEIIERLTVIRGVGPWTVEMLLMFTLGRPDVLPATDYGVRSGFALVYGMNELPLPKAVLAHGERWRPYRSAAAWYLWRALDLARETVK